MNKHKSNKIKKNSNTVRHLIMGQIITTQNPVAIKEVRHAGQWEPWLSRFLITFIEKMVSFLMEKEISRYLMPLQMLTIIDIFIQK